MAKSNHRVFKKVTSRKTDVLEYRPRDLMATDPKSTQFAPSKELPVRQHKQMGGVS